MSTVPPRKRKTATNKETTDISPKRQKLVDRKSTKSEDQARPNEKLAASVSSALTAEQPAFPRGGAGSLTLLEKKQIRAQASRDVAQEVRSQDLFGGNHDAQDSNDGESQLSGADEPKVSTKGQTKVKKRSKDKKPQRSATSTHSDKINIDGLSSRKINGDSLLLGRISNISKGGLTISLPNNLSGFVAPSAISQKYTSKLRRKHQEDSNDEGRSDEEVDTETADITEHFHVGQFLRVAVLESDSNKSAKKSKKSKIQLSIEPKSVNKGLSRAVLTPGIAVQASISSVEDHGAIVDIGFEDKTPAFISKSAFPEGQSLSALQEGSVILCSVASVNTKGKAVQLSANSMLPSFAKTTLSVNALLPGTLVDVLLTQVTQEGLAGKVAGVLDVTADALHSGLARDRDDFSDNYQVGQKITGCIIANFPQSSSKKLAFSILPALIERKEIAGPSFTLSSIIDKAQVISVVPNVGVYFSLSSSDIGFAHISRLSDQNVDMISELSGPYKKGSEHKVRILEHNVIDDLYIVSLQKSILEQPFLRLEDVKIGQVVSGTVQSVLAGTDAVDGLLIKIAPGITGYVPQMHLSDVVSKKPEKKFKDNMTVKARVLDINHGRRRLKLTLKKSLVNSDQPVWSSWDDIEVSQSTVGTLTKVEPRGATVHFYGSISGQLPVSEMSEAFIKDATEHFKVGQVLTVHVLRIDPLKHRLTLTARDPLTAVRNDTSTLSPGILLSGTVFEKNADDVMVRLQPNGVIARLQLDHVCDGSEKKRKSTLDKIRVGQNLEDLLVLEVRGRQVTLSNKASLREAATDGKLLTSFEHLEEGKIVTGFISNITDNRVFVAFAQGMTGAINKIQIPDDQTELPDFGLKRLRPIRARVIKIDYSAATPRFWLSMKIADHPKPEESTQEPAAVEKDIVQPVDETLDSYSQLVNGTRIKVRITSVKETQINVEIAKGIHGRIQVSEAFDNIEDIHDRKRPLKQFSPRQTLQTRIIGQHDSRSYRFLPLTHRSGKNVVFELSARPSTVADSSKEVLKMEDLKIGEFHLAYVNNISDNALMVNLSPAVRGRIRAADVSDDLNMAANLPANFPVGSVLRTKVLAVDVEKSHLDLSAKTGSSTRSLKIEGLSAGDIVAGRITKITDRAIIVQLSENLVGAVELIDLADDYDLADTTRFNKDEIVRASVVKVDVPNKKVFLSLRPSKVLSSGLEVKDPELSLDRLNLNEIRRGFVSNVSDKGVFVSLAQDLTALIQVTNLSDDFLKEWKNEFQKDQLVKGKIILVDRDSGHVQMSLRKSHLEGDYHRPIVFHDLKIGQIVKATVVKVETFGVFIQIQNSKIRGLCHRSEIAEKRIEDVTKAGFSEGDVVKAKVLKIDTKEKRVNFGMKASYFQEDDMQLDDDLSEASDANESVGDDESSEEVSGVKISTDSAAEDEDELDDELDNVDIEDSQDEMDVDEQPVVAGLSAGGFDWFGAPQTDEPSMKRTIESLDVEKEGLSSRKKKKRPEIKVDRTGELDKDGPQSVDDYERLLLSEPDNAELWVQFMAFHLDLGDVDQAREVGNKALRSIGLAQETEKMVIWSALLNLEAAYGDNDSVEATLQRACQTYDPEEVHNRLASIYIQSGEKEKADSLFQTMVKKFTQDPRLWVNYANFLFETMEDAARARALLPRALQALPPFTHFDITSKFAQLEFKTKTGVPEEGRTRFQGLVNLYPKRLDLFNVMIDLEMKLGEKEQVRTLFDQVLSKQLKPAKAKPFFQKWQEFEQREGDAEKIEEVQARAAKWVSEYQKKAAK